MVDRWGYYNVLPTHWQLQKAWNRNNYSTGTSRSIENISGPLISKIADIAAKTFVSNHLTEPLYKVPYRNSQDFSIL